MIPPAETCRKLETPSCEDCSVRGSYRRCEDVLALELLDLLPCSWRTGLWNWGTDPGSEGSRLLLAAAAEVRNPQEPVFMNLERGFVTSLCLSTQKPQCGSLAGAVAQAGLIPDSELLLGVVPW